MVNNDYEQYASEPTREGDLAKLALLAQAQLAAELKVNEAENALAQAAMALKAIAEHDIPDLMESLNLLEFKTTTGIHITVEEKIRASIPEERKPEAFAWLRKNKHDALIQRVVAVTFGKGEDSKATELLELLHQQKLQLSDKSSVHASTLAAFVREQLREGKDLPIETFGVFRQKASKISLPNPGQTKGDSRKRPHQQKG
jgi:hypothetical protein